MLNVIKYSDIKELSPLPASVVRLSQILTQPEPSLSEFNRVIELDPALTADVLRWANSAWSQSNAPIGNVRTAIIRLGSKNVLKLAIGNHLMSPLSRKFRGYNLSEDGLWRHSVAAALAAENLHRFTKMAVPPSSFAAAIMHDIGKLVLDRYLGAEPQQTAIKKLMTEESLPYLDAEKRVLGTDHAEVGAAIAREWKIPEALVNAIASHHAPDDRPEPLLDTVHIANAVAKLVGEGLGTEQMQMQVSSLAADRMGLTPESIQALCAVVKDQLETTEAKWWENHK